MKSVLISGNDTGIGKTWVLAALARGLSAQGVCVQVVKPVETGVPDGKAGDAQEVLEHCAGAVSAYRFYALPEPLAPVSAAERAGVSVSLLGIVGKISELEPCDVRLIEGAGGLAVPLESNGKDWADLAAALAVDTVVLVVEDRLGAINQARLLAHYAKSKGLPAVFVLNQIHAQSAEVLESNRAGLAGLGFPVLTQEELMAQLCPCVSK